MKNSYPKVSIIIPAYNAEKALKRCLNSVVAQTLKDFEAIIINDGSSDRTGYIADEFAKKDPRFRVLHQINSGVAVARQIGLDNAQGVYTIHIDADDWVDPDMLQELVSFAELNHSDMVLCDFYEIDDDMVVRYNCQKPYHDDRLSIFGLTFNTLSGSLCNKLIRRSCYEHYKVSFEKDVNYEEDKLICLKLLSHHITVNYLPKAFYHYDHTQNSNSLSHVGYRPHNRLGILKRIEAYCDISPVQQYFDNAVLYIAYQSLAYPITEFKSLFNDYYDSITRATGFRWHVKMFVILRLYGINLPSPNRIRYGLIKMKHRFNQ